MAIDRFVNLLLWPFNIGATQGKDTTEYNCGEDATFGLSCEAWTVDEGVSKMVASVLKSRRKYDGNAMAVYPWAEQRQAEALA